MKNIRIAALRAMVAANPPAGGNGLISRHSRYPAPETMERPVAAALDAMTDNALESHGKEK